RQDEFKRLALRRVEHHGRTVDTRTPVQLADARLMITRAVSGSMELARTRNVWQRLSDLGVLVSVASRSEIAVQSFSYDAVFKNPSLVTEPMVRSLPAIRQIFESPSGPDIPGYVDEQHEITKIEPSRVWQIANWSVDDSEYWLTREDYQYNNVATRNHQCLHIISGKIGGDLRVIDLSTRLGVAGTVGPGHLWPSHVDMLTLVAKRYLLASGQWLLDDDRWGLVYDLKDDQTLFFNGHLPGGNATK